MENKELKDEKLILAQIATGNQHAFSILFDFYRNKVYAYALKLLHSEELSKEIVQEIFIKIWIKREVLPNVDNFGGYLRVISKNETLNELKRIAIEQKNFSLSQKDWTEVNSDTQNSIEYRDTKQLVDQAIANLSPQQKIVYQLCQMQGMKQKEVAEQLNISPLTVKVHLREAVKYIRNFLQQHGVPFIFFLIFTTPF
ncbi:RNA polymerase sigma-70 factor [Pedobacter sp. MC2016-14]|uniref:RNA polymerase sigma factor n=1 Tax=Pedobacter sp. MC2016-14 TaxID=2897327 RepID=UPI001E4F25D5|nr:RNA polymerase sigma-70 factor [Pedobacter sp. MC2016-14]MCD0488645.1 RNA polymerase sigma-70 factor [Pedobacter sp. MC2016-14]